MLYSLDTSPHSYVTVLSNLQEVYVHHDARPGSGSNRREGGLLGSCLLKGVARAICFARQVSESLLRTMTPITEVFIVRNVFRTKLHSISRYTTLILRKGHQLHAHLPLQKSLLRGQVEGFYHGRSLNLHQVRRSSRDA